MEESNDLLLLGAASCFMRRDLNCVLSYFEATVPMYGLSESQSYFRLTIATFKEFVHNLYLLRCARVPRTVLNI